MFIMLYGLCAVVSWPIIAGMFFHDVQAIYTFDELRVKWFRKNLGMAIVLSGVYAAIWPIGLPGAWLMTGFAEHGVWKRRNS